MLTADRLREVLRYDPETGAFTWLVKTSRKVRIGSEAGSARPSTHRTPGKRRIKIDGLTYQANVLAFLYMTGRMPEGDVDHRDNDPGNDRWLNLREGTRSQNIANRHKTPGKSGFTGVRHVARNLSKPWRAVIRVQNKLRCLGYHATPEQAHAAWREAAISAFGEFAKVD
jgi:hypothetical protein